MCDSDKEVEDIKTEENVDYLKSIFNYFELRNFREISGKRLSISSRLRVILL